ncbi:MAG: guanylate kinase, partial [Eubacterium sp.]|nr:guanylate kinase [Eubacterium sp.]
MGKIVYIMGKSASGKDTIYSRLMLGGNITAEPIVTYTTRPIRHGETEGVEYHFCDEARMGEFEADGKIIERRTYDTVSGPWHYFTADDGSVDLAKGDYIAIGTLASYMKMKEYFGEEAL